jgi:hypothetical protein
MKKFHCFFFAILITGSTAFSQSALTKNELLPDLINRDSRFSVQATVMENDTWCHVTWPDPIGNYWELAADDGDAEDYFIYQEPGNMYANKFTPIGYPVIVSGGRIYVGDGSFPGPFLGTAFQVLVLDDDGYDGYPGTVLDSMDVTVNNYEWVEFEGMTASISEGDFYLAMKQTATLPNVAPVGVDLDNPTYNISYVYYQAFQGWEPSPLQDFMIRAWIIGYQASPRNIDEFQLARFSNFDPEGSPLLGDTIVLDTTNLSEYSDYDWMGLLPGHYAFGIKTHFTSGEWSDYDVSNVVSHLLDFYSPSCFYQADTGNRPLIFCQPLDTSGTVPFNFIGYNLYQDGSLVTFIPSSATSYSPDWISPVSTSYDLIAVYDLTYYGFPGETGESSGLSANYKLRYGYALDFQEQWNTGTFGTNNWSANGVNWSITDQNGQPSPCVQFTWDPIQENYSVSLESYPFLADSMSAGQIFLDFDIKLSNANASGTEFMSAEVWDWESLSWYTAKTYKNDYGSFDWVSEHLDISDYAMNEVFKIRFMAQGESSLNLVWWLIDNIHVYRHCNEPYNLELMENEEGIQLKWDGVEYDQWIHWDDGIYSGTSIGTTGATHFDAAARWIPAQLADYEGYSLMKVAFFPHVATATYQVRVWIGQGAVNLIVDQPVPNPIIDQWNYVTLVTPVLLDVSEELWVGYRVNNSTGYPAGVDNGPAVDGFGNMVNLGGWQTLLLINPDLDYNWNIQAYLYKNIQYNSSLKYAIYRSDDSGPFFLKDYSEHNNYLDVSACGLPPFYHEYKVTALHIGEIDTCESGFSNMVNEVCIGIAENEEDSLRIYPNPSNDIIKIESSEDLELISLYNSFGELILKKKVDKKQLEMPVSAYPAGVYMIRLESGKQLISKKIIILH